MKINNRFRLLFLVFIVLGVYYPTIFGGPNIIDDMEMLSRVEEMRSSDLCNLFIPQGGYYYRPLIVATFYLDKVLWNLTPSFMLLENILIHLANVLLVFQIAQRIFTGERYGTSEIPLISAFLFAVHPINTESINWISGRTDPLATFFVLVGLLVLLKSIDRKMLSVVFLSSLFVLLGVMTKEVAVVFLPAALIIAWAVMHEGHHAVMPDRERLKVMTAFTLPFLVIFFGYFLLRAIVTAHADLGLYDAFRSNPYDLLNSVRVLFKAFGFYVKKLFLPVPLNFAIVRIADGYVWLGVLSSVATLAMVRKRSIALVFLAVSFFTITPALVVPFMQKVWTPLAERYLYMPAAFFSIGIVGTLWLFFERFQKAKVLVPLFFVLLFPATWVTAQRNILWQDQVSLYQDTVSKSPEFSKIRNELALAMIDQGDYVKAKEQLETGLTLHGGKSNANFYINQAWLLYKENRFAEARDIVLNTFKKKEDGHPELLKMLAKIDHGILFNMHSPDEKISVWRELLETYEVLFEKTGDPFFLYLAGKNALSLGDKKKASSYFFAVASTAPEDAYYLLAAKKMAVKFAENLQ